MCPTDTKSIYMLKLKTVTFLFKYKVFLLYGVPEKIVTKIYAFFQQFEKLKCI